jgi:hypothetical protein
MRREEAEILMQHALDGVLSDKDKARLARALKADPILNNEFEELKAVHAATKSMFEQLELPRDFSGRVMQRIQDSHVPADAGVESVRLPKARRGVSGRSSVPAPPVLHLQRRRERIFQVVSAVSVAAALLLALGVFTGVFSNQQVQNTGGNVAEGTQPGDASGTTSQQGENLTRGSQGGPGVEGNHRTDPSVLPSKEREASGPETDSEASPAPASDNRVPDSGEGRQDPASGESSPPTPRDPKPAPQGPIAPDLPEVVVEEEEAESPGEEDRHSEDEITPRRPTVVEGEGASETPESVERPASGSTSAGGEVVEERPALGSLTVFSGRLEVLGADGAWARLADGADIKGGAQYRTNVNGVVMLALPSGNVVIGRGSELELDNYGAGKLVSGEVFVERLPQSEGSSFVLHCNEYTVSVASGCTVVTLRRRGLQVRTPVGHSSLTSDRLGVIAIDSGFELDHDFSREFAEPQEGMLVLPDWSGDGRTASLLSLAEPTLLATRDLSGGERRYFDRNVPRDLKRVLRYAVDSESALEMLNAMFRNENFDSRTFSSIFNEVEIAFVEVAEHDCNTIARFAARASNAAEDFANFRERFNQLLRPAPPAQPSQPRPGRAGNECPLDRERARRNPHLPRRNPQARQNDDG